MKISLKTPKCPEPICDGIYLRAKNDAYIDILKKEVKEFDLYRFTFTEISVLKENGFDFNFYFYTNSCSSLVR